MATVWDSRRRKPSRALTLNCATIMVSVTYLAIVWILVLLSSLSLVFTTSTASAFQSPLGFLLSSRGIESGVWIVEIKRLVLVGLCTLVLVSWIFAEAPTCFKSFCLLNLYESLHKNTLVRNFFSLTFFILVLLFGTVQGHALSNSANISTFIDLEDCSICNALVAYYAWFFVTR